MLSLVAEVSDPFSAGGYFLRTVGPCPIPIRYHSGTHSCFTKSLGAPVARVDRGAVDVPTSLIEFLSFFSIHQLISP